MSTSLVESAEKPYTDEATTFVKNRILQRVFIVVQYMCVPELAASVQIISGLYFVYKHETCTGEPVPETTQKN